MTSGSKSLFDGGVMSSACGECTMCCTLRGVPELRKRPFSPCPKCGVSGCNEYQSRPVTCREYRCVWLELEDEGDRRMSLDERPDRCGVIFERTEGLEGYQCVVDPTRPDAWLTPPAHEIISALKWLSMPYVVFTTDTRVLSTNVLVLQSAEELALLKEWDEAELSSKAPSSPSD